MELQSQVAASLLQTRQEATFSIIRSNAEQERQLADQLQSAQASVPGSPVRGTNVNIQV
ncbi:MAG: hypothetical protein AAF549_03585 [Pseudomonadota bacterium]